MFEKCLRPAWLACHGRILVDQVDRIQFLHPNRSIGITLQSIIDLVEMGITLKGTYQCFQDEKKIS